MIGKHGAEADRLVNLHRLLLCQDLEEGSKYNLDEYRHYNLVPELVLDLVRMRHGGKKGPAILESTEEQAAVIRQHLAFPDTHGLYKLFWCGMDVGLVADPSELLIAAEYQPSVTEIKNDIATGIAVPLNEQSRIKVLARITMKRLPMPLQEEVVMHVIELRLHRHRLATLPGAPAARRHVDADPRLHHRGQRTPGS